MNRSSSRLSLPREIRQRLGPRLNALVERVGGPTTQVYPAGYVGTVPAPIADVETMLADAGFAWDPLSMYHRTPAGSTTDGSWAYRSTPFADRQLHVVLFSQRSGRTDVYAHDEYSWLRHPVKHVGEVDVRREEAVSELRRTFDANDVPYDVESRPQRMLRHGLERLRVRVTERGRVP